MAKKRKLNSIRLLEAKRIPHEVYSYDPRIRDARKVAAAVGIPASTVFKTLVAQISSHKKPILVMLPCDCTLNLKQLAKVVSAKKAALTSHADAEKLTGLKVGGISPLALRHKRWPVYLDRRALEHADIVISAGQRGTQTCLAVDALMELTACKLVDVADC